MSRKLMLGDLLAIQSLAKDSLIQMPASARLPIMRRALTVGERHVVAVMTALNSYFGDISIDIELEVPDSDSVNDS